MSHSAGGGVAPKKSDKHTVIQSAVLPGSEIQDSEIQNSEVQNSEIQDSEAQDSDVKDSKIKNSKANREAVDQPVIDQSQFLLLAGSVFIIAACSLIYELLISSLSTYLLGSSVIHYSLTIGLFLFFMGIGAWMAQSVTQHLIPVFVSIEIAIGAVGGISGLLLLAAYAWTDLYYLAMLIVVAAIGVLVGMELPLLTRILESRSGLRRGISQVLTFDYIGALLASLLFPFILLPYFGHLLTATAVGLLNLFVALVVAWSFRNHLQHWRLRIIGGVVLACSLLVVCVLWIKPAEELIETALYEDPVIETQQSRYQKIVMTERGEDFRLYLDGNLQFSSVDEYRYHETLVHLPIAFARKVEHALVIGGGDGLAARELLKYPNLKSIDVVDLDPAVTALASSQPHLVKLNEHAMSNARVSVVNEDAWQWLSEEGNLYDLIVIDLPDPESEDVAKLYSVAFYQRIARRLSVGGVMITQATSPWFARRAFWSIGNTLEVVFEHVRPATVYVPSFGLWGFFVASQHDLSTPFKAALTGRYINEDSLHDAMRLPADLPRLETQINRNHSLPIIDYYREGWGALNHATELPSENATNKTNEQSVEATIEQSAVEKSTVKPVQ